MPAEVLDDPLGISCVFSDGRWATVTPGGLASEQLARDLLTGLAELVHPHGTVDSAGSIRHYVSALRVMDAALAERGFTGGAADLRRAQGAGVWVGTPGARGASTRRVLPCPAAAGGTPAAVRAPAAACDVSAAASLAEKLRRVTGSRRIELADGDQALRVL